MLHDLEEILSDRGEFGRIDLAMEKAEETQKRVETLTRALERLQKDFTSTTNKIRERSDFAIVLNHLSPFIYGQWKGAPQSASP